MSGYIATSKSVEHRTPDNVLEVVNRFYKGKPDLDPAGNRKARDLAKRVILLPEDGLTVPWRGKIFVNPPWGRGIEDWYERASKINRKRDHCIVLGPATLGTRYWQEYGLKADARCWIRGRLKFKGDKQYAVIAVGLAYWGPHAARFVATFSALGHTEMRPQIWHDESWGSV